MPTPVPSLLLMFPLLPLLLCLPCSATPTEAHASLVVDALWGTGLPWAQAKARQLFERATW